MKYPTRSLCPLAGSIALLFCASARADSVKAENTAPLNQSDSWTNLLVPGAADYAIWDGTISSGNNSPLGGDLSVFGLRVTNVGGTRNGTGNSVTIGNSAGATLTIGEGGIDMGSALQAFRIQSAVTLGGSQIWNIANANTNGNPLGLNKNEDLSFSAGSTGIIFDLAGFTVTKVGAGTAAFALGPTITSSAPGGNFQVSGGVLLIQSGSSRATTVTDSVAFTVNPGTTLQFSAESGSGGVAIQNGGSITLNGGTLLMQANQNNANHHTGNIVAAANSVWNLTGGQVAPVTFSGNLSGTGNITHSNTATDNRLVMSGDNSDYSGTFTLSGGTNTRALRFAAETAGSPNATWVVNEGNTIEVDGVSVQLGTLNGAGSVNASSGSGVVNIGAGDFTGVLADAGGSLALTKVGDGTLTLNGANSYTGPTVVSAGTLITTPAHTLASGVMVNDGATFGVKLQAGGTTLVTPSLTTGSISGATLRFDTMGFGNPVAPMISTTTFTPLATTTFDLTGTVLTSGLARLLDYVGAIGGGGFGNLALTLPFRVSGTLIDNAADTAIDVQLGVETPRWNGDTNGDWDIENTPNWRTLTSNTATQYFQGVNTDSVSFDDSATGTTSVNLTTVLTPMPGATVNNDEKTYTFGGTGILSGDALLTKSGPGTLILANTTAYDHTGGTIVSEGLLQIGDGTTPGVGVIPLDGITNNSIVLLNRPDDFSGSITGDGSILKDRAGAFTLTNAISTTSPIGLLDGTFALGAGGTISGVISGPGKLTATGGILQITGSEPNTHTGLTTVAAGTLRLNKPAGINAVAGDVEITGSGVLALLASEQIPDTATLTFTGASGDSLAGAAAGATETIANAVVNASVPSGQLILRNDFTITDTAVVQNGILGVASSHNATINRINMSGGLVRIAGNGGPSTLTVGAGGIIASGGEIQVKFNVNNQDAVLNLGGDFTTTGNVLVSNAGYTGDNLNVINLVGDRVFTIGELTTTAIHADFAGTGGLTKAGLGTLELAPTSIAEHAGPTVVSEGILEVNGSIIGSTVTVDGGTLAGTGTIVPGPFGLLVEEGGRLAPGGPFFPGTLSVNLGAGGSLDVFDAIAPVNSQALSFRLEQPGFSDKITITGGSLFIAGGVLEFDDFTFSAGFGFDPGGTYTLFDGETEIFGTLGVQVAGQVGGQPFELQFADSNRDLVLVSIPEPGSAILLLSGLGAFGLRRRRSVRA